MPYKKNLGGEALIPPTPAYALQYSQFVLYWLRQPLCFWTNKGN